ncbi:MAG: hypothetical protein AB7R89_31525 [Dehalococcoidia bacterium]
MFNHPPAYEPRASRILIPGRHDLPTELWMGGANSLHGDLLLPTELCDAWLIDLAGEMPDEHRLACACWLPRVFADIETVPQHYERLDALARSIAASINGEAPRDPWPHPAEPPRRVYIMCQQGMNRSGLLTGLILRALGVSTKDALATIASRPGALTNQTYLRLMHDWADAHTV